MGSDGNICRRCKPERCSFHGEHRDSYDVKGVDILQEFVDMVAQYLEDDGARG